jgi:hypothetical protein
MWIRYERYLDREFSYPQLPPEKEIWRFADYIRQNNLERFFIGDYKRQLLCDYEAEEGKKHRENYVDAMANMRWVKEHEDLFRLWLL